MADEKPLHVQVAEALGVTGPCEKPEYQSDGDPYDHDPVGAHCGTCGAFMSLYGPDFMTAPHEKPIRRYDTDWSVTGPLIQRFRIRVAPPECAEDCPEGGSHALWTADSVDQDVEETGETALIAVCRFILALGRERVLADGRD